MIKLENVIKIYKYKDQDYKAVNEISLDIKDGELVSIMGKSGAGKSTLLHLIAGIDDVSSGKIIIKDTDITALSDTKLASFRNKNIGIILQDFALIEDFSIEENIQIPIIGFKGKKDKINKVMNDLGILHLKNKQINKLSGGEKQRVAIARAIITDPDIILADEPTGSLDVENGNNIINLLLDLNKNGKTVIIVTHDKDIAERTNRKIVLSDGKIIIDKIDTLNS